MQITYDSAHSFIPYVNSYHARPAGIAPPPHPCQIIPCAHTSSSQEGKFNNSCKNYHKVITRASMSKSSKIVPNTLCLQAFQHKNLKKPMLFQQKLFKFRVRALMLKSYKNHRFLMNSGKSTDFISPRGAPAILLSCAEGTNPLQKIPRGPHARTAARA